TPSSRRLVPNAWPRHSRGSRKASHATGSICSPLPVTDDVMRIAHFIQRYLPARGGSEVYFERLSRHLAHSGHDVTVFTSDAIDLEAFWSRRGRRAPAGESLENGVRVRRYPLVSFPLRRFMLKGLSLAPHRLWQCMTLPCNPISLDLWRDAGR